MEKTVLYMFSVDKWNLDRLAALEQKSGIHQKVRNVCELTFTANQFKKASLKNKRTSEDEMLIFVVLSGAPV